MGGQVPEGRSKGSWSCSNCHTINYYTIHQDTCQRCGRQRVQEGAGGMAAGGSAASGAAAAAPQPPMEEAIVELAENEF